MADSLIQTILDEDYASLKNSCEQIVAKKLHNRIQAQKVNVLAEINKVSVQKMNDIIATSKK